MELYTFTNTSENEWLMKVRSDREVNLLPGFHRIIEELVDGSIIHSFRLITKVQDKNVGNIYYSWYTVKEYSCSKDDNSFVIKAIEPTQATIDYNIMMGNLETPEEE